MKVKRADWLGFWIVMAVSALMLLTIYSEAKACGSFEECMKEPDMHYDRSDETRTMRYTKAIAYKLDEISKKLDKPTVSEIPNRLLTSTMSSVPAATFTGELIPYEEQPQHGRASEDKK